MKYIKKYNYNTTLNKHKNGFSLVNIMIILTIISIMLAISAPLISGPSNVDSDSPFKYRDEDNIDTAIGNYQKINVGGKLNVNSTDEDDIKNNLTANTWINRGSFNIRKLLQVDFAGFKILNNIGKILFLIDDTGITNIQSYDIGTDLSHLISSTSFVAPQDGYVYCSDSINKDITLNDTGAPVSNIEYTNSNFSNYEITKPGTNGHLTSFARMLPISKGTTINNVDGCIFYKVASNLNTVAPSYNISSIIIATAQAPVNDNEGENNDYPIVYEITPDLPDGCTLDADCDIGGSTYTKQEVAEDITVTLPNGTVTTLKAGIYYMSNKGKQERESGVHNYYKEAKEFCTDNTHMASLAELKAYGLFEPNSGTWWSSDTPQPARGYAYALFTGEKTGITVIAASQTSPGYRTLCVVNSK